jgi:hypothetical protein
MGEKRIVVRLEGPFSTGLLLLYAAREAELGCSLTLVDPQRVKVAVAGDAATVRAVLDDAGIEMPQGRGGE